MVLIHIEIPYGSSVKYEYENEKLIVDRILSTSMNYPGNYGYIPKTLADDGDPIDVLVVNTQPLLPTSYIDCKVLGMLVTEDEKGFDQKVIAIPSEKIDRGLSHINDIADLNDTQLQIIKDFFSHYKANEPDKWVKVYDYENAGKTMEFIAEHTIE
jgi:inorganic pyrophosphatase